ncbi:MAG: TIGR01244 family sulfur transferase [Sphingomicrobium sp.]
MAPQLDDKSLISGQIAAADVVALAAAGVTMIVNNRPDHEDSGQPLGSEIEAAAASAGIAYRHVPIIRGIGPGDVEAMREAMTAAGDGKMLAFCRSGQRSALACALAQREQGVEREEVERRLKAAGFDPAPIQHLL